MTTLDDPAHDREAGERRATRDTTRIDDTRIDAVRPLITPALLMEKLPGTERTLALVERSREEIGRVLRGEDDRLVVVVGPCSIHDHEQAVRYAALLETAAASFDDALITVMRVYFEKPRTTIGWKGYINDPHLDGSFAINEGLERARRLLIEIVEMGVPIGTEFLDLLSPQFLSDLVAWGAIGARTTESQTHRQLASGLSCPVGFKNGTDGNVQVAADAIVAAAARHSFIGMTKMGQAAIFETRGNRACHVVLRGGTQPNYSEEAVRAACTVLARAGLREQLMIDVSHANSRKQHRRQIDIVGDLARRVAAGERAILGVMIESHLEEGRQDLVIGRPLAPGLSITDACIGWEQTAPLLADLAHAVRVRRALPRSG